MIFIIGFLLLIISLQILLLSIDNKLDKLMRFFDLEEKRVSKFKK